MSERQREGLSPAEEEKTDRKGQLLPILAAALGNAMWGFSVLFSKVAMQEAPPDVMLSIRFVLATLLMSIPLLLGKAKISFRGKKAGPLLTLAAMELLYFYFESYGILYTNATFAGVVLAVVPVVAILPAMLFLKEYPTRRQALFCVLPVAGVILMTVSGSSLGIIRPLGVVLLICSCLSSSIYKTANRRAAEEFSSFERTYIVLAACALVFTLSALRTVEGDLRVYVQPLSNPRFLLPVLMLSGFCSVGSNMLVNYAAGRMSVVKVSSFGSLTTLCAMFAGVLFLDEPMTFSIFLGAVLILVGIRQVTKK